MDAAGQASLRFAAAYIRVSTEDQLEYSPESQLQLIREHAKREGYLIPPEFVYQDSGISGRSAARRPAFCAMIAQAKEDPPPFSAIFVWKYSRFARNQEEAIVYKNLLKKQQVEVRSISEPSGDSPFSSLIERIIEWMDEYYVINLAGEVRRGMTEKARRGEAMGTAPYGYRVRDKVLTEDAEEAAVVRYLFASYAAGVGTRTLAREMNERGIKTRRGNAPDNRWVHYILTNPAYIGKTRWSTDGRANYDRAGYQGENVQVSEGRHSPIIDMALWDAVQERIGKRDTEMKYRNSSKPYMLKGLIRCGSCGATLTLLSTSSPSLQCHKYACGQCRVSHCITLKKADAAVTTYLESAVETGDFTFSPPTPRTGPSPSPDWEKQIDAEQKRLERAKSAFLDGTFSAEEYRETKKELESEIQKLQARLAAAQTPAPAPPPVARTRQRVAEVLTVIKSPDIGEQEKNEALRSIIDNIVYHKPSNVMELFFAWNL